MNKLAPLALILLMFFGSVLWYLANSELNASIKARIIQVAQYYTEQKVSIEKVEINLNQGYGKVYGLKLHNPIHYQEQYMLTIEQLSFTFNAKNLNENIINIHELKLDGSKFIIEFKNNDDKVVQSNFENLYQLLNNKIALIQDRRKQKSEPYIKSEKITLLNSQISPLPSTHSRINSSTTDITTSSKIVLNPIGGETGLPASLFGIEVLRKTLEKVANLEQKK